MRFTGRRALSPTNEARTQRWVAASFFLLAPYIGIQAVRKLIGGGETPTTVVAVGLTLSAPARTPAPDAGCCT